MSRFFSNRFATLAPYTPGEQPRDMQYVKLNTNESPFPPAPGVMEAITRSQVSQLNLYSDPTARTLEDAIASFYDLDATQVIAGNGSDEILAFAFQAFSGPDTGVCFADITYGFYKVFAQLYSLDAHILPLRDDFSINPANYADAGRTIFIANPNAPTGQVLSRAEIEGIIRSNPNNVVVIDEAYVDFGGESVVPLINRYDNLLVTMTFSKSRSLAGGRIGFALGQKPLIDDLRAMKYSFNPYSLNRLSLLAGTAAMEDRAYFEQCTTAIKETRAWCTTALRERGFDIANSYGNFIFANPVRLSGEDYYQQLKARGVLVRHFTAPRIANHARITIGSREQMQVLLDATDDILEAIK